MLNTLGRTHGCDPTQKRKTETISRVTATLLIMPPHSPRTDSGGTPTADAQCAPLRRGLMVFEQLQLIKRLFIF